MPGVVFFGATRCAYCPAVKAVVEQYKSNQGNDGIDVTTVIVDESNSNMALAQQWGVSGVPALVFIKYGEERFRHLGPITQEKFEEYVERYLQRDFFQDASGGESEASCAVLCRPGEQANTTA